MYLLMPIFFLETILFMFFVFNDCNLKNMGFRKLNILFPSLEII